MITVIRSPAKVSWHIMFNGTLLATADTKAEANERAEGLAKRYGLRFTPC